VILSLQELNDPKELSDSEEDFLFCELEGEDVRVMIDLFLGCKYRLNSLSHTFRSYNYK